MAVTTFAVTATMLQQTHFPHLSAFSAMSVPTSDVVAAIIERKAARLAGRLLKEGLTASTFQSGTEPYLQAQDLLLLEAAIDVAQRMPGFSPEALKSMQAELAGRYKELDEDSWVAFGAAQPAELPDGPEHHIDTHHLATEDETDISPVADKLRASDLL